MHGNSGAEHNSGRLWLDEIVIASKPRTISRTSVPDLGGINYDNIEVTKSYSDADGPTYHLTLEADGCPAPDAGPVLDIDTSLVTGLQREETIRTPRTAPVSGTATAVLTMADGETRSVEFDVQSTAEQLEQALEFQGGFGDVTVRRTRSCREGYR